MSTLPEEAMLHTPGPWECKPRGDGWHITGTVKGHFANVAIVYGMKGHDARLIAACPDLIALARQYASECGDCAGARIQPDDEPCMECADIWAVINKAEGRS